jgi:hypothetical protein
VCGNTGRSGGGKLVGLGIRERREEPSHRVGFEEAAAPSAPAAEDVSSRGDSDEVLRLSKLRGGMMLFVGVAADFDVCSGLDVAVSSPNVAGPLPDSFVDLLLCLSL